MKAKSPLFYELRKGMGNLDIRTRKNGAIELGLKRIPTNPKTQAQREWRDIYNSAVAAWNALSPAEKAEYEQQGKAEGLPGYNVFMREYLLNPPAGILYVISVYNPGSALSNFQVMLQVNGDSEFFSAIPNSTGLEIKKTDKATPVPFWIESWDATGKNATIWIKFDSIAASATTQAYIYYNQNRTQPLSSPSSVFDFWDDMDSQGSWRKVRIGGSGFAKWENSYLKIKSTSDQTVVDIAQSLSNYAIDVKVYAANPVENFNFGATNGSYNTYGFPQYGYYCCWNGWAGQSNRQRIIRFLNYVGLDIAQTSQGLLQASNAYILTAWRLYPTLKQFVNYSQILSIDDTNITSHSYLYLSTWGSTTYPSEYWIDWVRVRKVCSQTLTVSYAKP